MGNDSLIGLFLAHFEYQGQMTFSGRYFCPFENASRLMSRKYWIYTLGITACCTCVPWRLFQYGCLYGKEIRIDVAQVTQELLAQSILEIILCRHLVIAIKLGGSLIKLYQEIWICHITIKWPHFVLNVLKH